MNALAIFLAYFSVLSLVSTGLYLWWVERR